MVSIEKIYDGDPNTEDQDGPKKPDTEKSSSEPVRKFRLSPLVLTIFEREHDGETYYSGQLQRVYTRDDGESFEYTDNLRPRDMRKAARLWQAAADELEGLTAEDVEAE